MVVSNEQSNVRLARWGTFGLVYQFFVPLVTTTLVLLASVTQAGESRMNIILIFSDDVGAETVGVYGGESYDTPRLDQMAREGVRFDFAHAQPLCTPSRVKIMTGQYNFRNYTHFGYLDPKQTTFAHILYQPNKPNTYTPPEAEHAPRPSNFGRGVTILGARPPNLERDRSHSAAK